MIWEQVCGFCKKPFDYEYWIGTEECKHCKKFLDNPPYVKRIRRSETLAKKPTSKKEGN